MRSSRSALRSISSDENARTEIALFVGANTPAVRFIPISLSVLHVIGISTDPLVIFRFAGNKSWASRVLPNVG